jgi:SOS response regulatory protein OraA/RecX
MDQDFSTAMEVALKRLAASDRFESEVRTALSMFPPEIVDRVVTHLKERRMLDDSRTTEQLLLQNQGRRAVGAERLRAKLERRGAPDSVVERAAAEATEGDGERARLLIASKYPDRTSKERNRAARLLYSRGFGEEAIEAALSATFGDSIEPSADDVFNH